MKKLFLLLRCYLIDHDWALDTEILYATATCRRCGKVRRWTFS